MAQKQIKKYSFWIGLKKTIKNVAIIVLPYVVTQIAAADLTNITWVDALGLVFSCGLYFVKNFKDNKDNGAKK